MAISQSELKEHMAYFPETGVFIRIRSRGRPDRVGRTAGSINALGYVVFSVRCKKITGHRAAFLYMTGNIPEFVDHINGDKSDNRWANLRPATKQQNGRNRPADCRNKSGVKGVCWYKPYSKWRARVTVGRGVAHHVGYFDSLDEAEEAVKNARDKIHGEYANHG